MEYSGKDFVIRLEKAWTEKESKKPEEKRRKFTNTILANDLGVNNTQITKWQGGSRYPNTETLIKIKEYLDVSMEYLLGLNEPENKISKEKTIYDIMRDFLIYDMMNNKKKYVPEEYLDRTINEIHLMCERLEFNQDIVFILDEYLRMKIAFRYVKDEQIKISMINTLIDKYREIT